MKRALFNRPVTRRKMLSNALVAGVGLSLSGVASLSLAQDAMPIAIDVYKDPNCGCCANWIEHMDDSGFASKVHHPRDLNGLKLKHGIKPELQSCHTAVTKEGYAFEGHVPAKYIRRFLARAPANAKGLAVPGMPMESPGMEMGGSFTPYDVILFNTDGSTSVYASIKSAKQQY
ncbi:MAG: DUF411 domain-containing protein [Gammaproteobacteria bacterium]|nr:DUF411 domain-containing protein [Gammaproteobacteria bacterium]